MSDMGACQEDYEIGCASEGPLKDDSRLRKPTLFEPPVTKNTLNELDVNKIVHNPKLRHDINFDPDLHFRPNLDGERGRRKKQKTDNFWETMRSQLRGYLMDREGFEKELGDAEWCLPATLKAIRGILQTLVPQRDRASVKETFNVDLLMQQFRKGDANLVKLAMWLSQLLKSHCAPMREDWVDDMVTQLSNSGRNRDVGQLVDGIQNLLAVLEAMKLDVANHQIRCLRPLLIEDTWDFMKALVNLTLPSKSSEIVPHTFLFDEERLIKLRSDMLDLINLEICMHMFRGLEATSRMQDSRFMPHDDIPVTSFTSSPYNRPASPATAGDQSQIPLGERPYPSSEKVILRDWTLKDSLRIGVGIGRKFIATLNCLHSFFRVLVIFECFHAVRSWPAHSSPNHVDGPADGGTYSRQEFDLSGFLHFFKVVAECFVLLSNFHAISQKQSEAMRLFTGGSAFGVWYVGMDERVSEYELVPAWLSTAGLFYQHFSKQLEPFERTGAATGTFIVATAVFLVETIRRHCAPFEGRYSSPLALHMGSVLPATVIAEWTWEAFVLETGLAKCIEDAIAYLPDTISRPFSRASYATGPADGKDVLIPNGGLTSNLSYEHACGPLQVLQPHDKTPSSTYMGFNNSVQNEPVTAQNAHTILFVSTGPYGLGNLDIQKEKAELSEALALCNRPDMFRIVDADSIRPDTLGPRLRRTKGLAIMHFAGHGNRNGDFVFQDKYGHIKIVDARALGDLLELAKKNGLQVAVLNNCYSDEKAQYIANKVGVAVAIKGMVQDAAAIAFTSAFYGALGDSETLNVTGVQEAFKWALRELRMSFSESAGKPQLLLRQ